MLLIEELQAHLATRLADGAGTGAEIWAAYREMARQPVDWSGGATGDSLLITFGYASLAREQLVLKLVRQFLVGTADALTSGLQLQICLFYPVDDDSERRLKALQALNRLGSWAFSDKVAFLDYAEGLPALPALMVEANPLAVDVRLENLLN